MRKSWLAPLAVSAVLTLAAPAHSQAPTPSTPLPLPAELDDVQAKLFRAAFDSFVSDFRAAHPEFQATLAAGDQPLTAPAYSAKFGRGDWIAAFVDRVGELRKMTPEVLWDFKTKADAQFTSYYHDKGYSRVPYMQVFQSVAGSQDVKSVENVTLAKSYPQNHTLDVPGYVAERFPRVLQEFVQKNKVPLFIDDSNCADTFAYQSSFGFTQAVRFMGARDNEESQFLFVYNPQMRSYRLAVCDIHGQDDQTRILAILGPVFTDGRAQVVRHRSPAPLFDFNPEGQDLKLTAKDRVILGFQNTVWWQLKSADSAWDRRVITNTGAEVSLFENKITGARFVSVANVYGDEMLQALQSLYDKGARRFIYLGTSGGLDPALQIGDVLLPRRFWKPDGSWIAFINGAETLNIQPPPPARKVSGSSQGWAGTLVVETKDYLGALRDSGAQALDVESRYFAEFTMNHPVEEKIAIMVVSDQPLGAANYNNENATRSVPMKSITTVLPQVVISAIVDLYTKGSGRHLPASVK